MPRLIQQAVFLCLALGLAVLSACSREDAPAKAADQVMADIKNGNFTALENAKLQGLNLNFGPFGQAIGRILQKSMQDGMTYKREKVLMGKDGKQAKVYYRGEDNFGKKEKAYTVLLMARNAQGQWLLSGISLEEAHEQKQS